MARSSLVKPTADKSLKTTPSNIKTPESEAFWFYNSRHLPEIPEAQLFELQYGEWVIHGAEIGPVNGKPLLLVGGYSTSFPYLRKFIRELNRLGYKVYVYNPPGQGDDLIRSHRNSSDELEGLNSMLEVYPILRSKIYELNHKTPVVAVGHSLGGFQIRAASLGLKNPSSDNAHWSDKELKKQREQTALLVPVYSFGIWEDPQSKEVSSLGAWALKEALPFTSSCLIEIGCYLPDFLRDQIQHHTSKFLSFSQDRHLKGLIGASDLDFYEFKELLPHWTLQRISPQIRKDLRLWHKEMQFLTSHGHNISDRWRAVQNSPHSFPIHYVIGEHDLLTPPQPFFREAKKQPHASALWTPTGHMGMFFSDDWARQVAVSIYKKHQVVLSSSCEKNLAK